MYYVCLYMCVGICVHECVSVCMYVFGAEEAGDVREDLSTQSILLLLSSGFS